MAIIVAEIKEIERQARKKIQYFEWYGMKKGLLFYLNLPQFLPLNVHLQHGAGMIYRNDVPDPIVLDTKFKNIFLCNSYQKNICEKYLPSKNISISGSIYPLYRQAMGIEQDQNAEGTLFFPVHSTESVIADDNIDKTLEMLRGLPDHLKPIKVSIYYKDLLRGLNKIYEENNFEVLTFGHRNDPKFIDRFYRTLKTVKYTIGTTIGSQTYYAIEMGIPYFIFGDTPVMKNNGNKYYPDEIINAKSQSRLGYAKHDEVRKLFIKENFRENLAVTETQVNFVLDSIGYHEKLPKQKLRNLVLKSFFLN